MADRDPVGLPTLRERHVERREDLPADPPPGDYVVVDVMHFSTTVVELLANGASCVHVPNERGGERDFRRDNPEALIGGPRTPDYEPPAGYDFFNSPSYVQSVPVEGRPTSMTSKNGGRTVAELRTAGDGVEVFIGTTTNARAVAQHLRSRDRPTTIVSAGTLGDRATEDLIGAVLVGRHLDGVPPTPAERRLFTEHLRVARGPDYLDKHPVRRRDVQEYDTAFDSRSIVPVLDGDRIVSATNGESTAAATAPA